MCQYLLYGGPLAGQYIALPVGTGQLKIQYDPYQGLDGSAKYRVGFYVRRTSSSLEWQPDPH